MRRRASRRGELVVVDLTSGARESALGCQDDLDVAEVEEATSSVSLDPKDAACKLPERLELLSTKVLTAAEKLGALYALLSSDARFAGKVVVFVNAISTARRLATALEHLRLNRPQRRAARFSRT